jgi:hypothetical protein
VAAAFAVALFYIVGQMQGLYRAWDKAPIGRELTRVLVCWGLVVPLTS